MTDEPTDRPAPATEPIELSEQDIDLIVRALRYLESTLGSEESDQLARFGQVLARLGAVPAVVEPTHTR
jgi:hypothetical protein